MSGKGHNNVRLPYTIYADVLFSSSAQIYICNINVLTFRFRKLSE